MTARDECRRVARLLEELDSGSEAAVASADLEAAARHLETCSSCGMTEAGAESVVEGVRAIELELPDDAFFASSAADIMAAVRAEPAGDSNVVSLGRAGAREGRRAVDPGRRAGTPSRTRRSGRVRIAGGVAALAAGVVLFVTAYMLGGGTTRPESQTAALSVDASQVAVVSVDDVDLDEIVSSDDAWLVASYDIFDLDLVDPNAGLDVEDLSDAELDALEGVFGSAPSLG